MSRWATLRLRLKPVQPAMLAAIKNFFRQYLDDDPAQSGSAADQRTHLAAAALFIEVLRADGSFSVLEREGLLKTLAERFHLETAEADQLLALADASAQEATDLYQFTSEINRRFDAAQKVRLIETLWHVAYADEVMDYREEHLIRRISELIHVPHSVFIAAKLRVQRER